MPKPEIIINSQIIKVSFLQKVINQVGKPEAGRVFYRARHSKSIVGWIRKGLVKDSETGVRYAMISVKEEYSMPMDVQTWIDTNIYPENGTNKIFKKSKSNMIGDILTELEVF